MLDEDTKQSLVDSTGLIVAARIATVIGFPVAGFFGGWAFLLLMSLQTDVAVMKQQLAQVTQNPYSSEDARRDLALVSNRIDNNSTDIKSLQRQMNSMSDFVNRRPVR